MYEMKSDTYPHTYLVFNQLAGTFADVHTAGVYLMESEAMKEAGPYISSTCHSISSILITLQDDEA